MKKSNNELLDELEELHRVNSELQTEIIKEKQLEEEFERFFNLIPDLACIASTDAKFLKINSNWEAMLGYTQEEILSTSFLDFIHPDDVEKTIKEVQKQTRGNKVLNFQNRYRCKDGSYRWLEWSSIPAANNSILYSTARDITAQKQIEVEREQFYKFFQTSTDLMCMADPKGAFVKINRACIEALGYSEAELISKPFVDFIVPEDRRKTIDEMAQQIQKGFTLNFVNRYICKDGSIKWLSWRAIYNNEDGITYATARDITARKQSEEKILHLSNERQTIIDNIGSGIFFLKNGKVVWANTKAIEMLGYELDELIGYDTSKFYIDIEVFQNFGSRANPFLTKGQRFSCEEKLITKTGKILWAYLIGQAINPKDLREGTIWIAEDITQRKQMEEKIQEQNKELAEANASKDKFFSIIAHDLKNPFNAYLGLTEMMQHPDTSIEKMKELSSMMNKSADNLSKLLENLLTWARMQRGAIEFRPEYCFLSTILNRNLSVLNQNAKLKGIDIISQNLVDLKVFADLSMLDTVFRNLISNAIKFTPRGGKIIISAEKKDNEILITIEDTGIGMNEKIRNGIFKIDQKTSRPGTEKESSTGLGLLLCKEFIERHNGKIWAESEEDKGSTFYFTLCDA